MSEVNWEKMFAYDQAEPNVENVKKERCACGGKNCRTAKRIRCVCRCHAEFHGVENRRGMEALDKVLGLETEVPAPKLIPWFEIC